MLVNRKVRNSHKFIVGILDTISLETLNEHYRVLYDKKGKFLLHKTTKEEAESKIVKIINKTILKKKKTQLNFHDGTNLIVEKDGYKSGDTLIMKEGRIKKHLKFEKDALAYLVRGKHKGRVGIVENIEESSAITKGKITLKTETGDITTKKDFAFIIEKLIIK